MGNVFISAFIAVLSLQFFTITYRLNGMHRTFMNIPISIFETSIPLISDDGAVDPLFQKSLVEEKVDQYFANNIKKYTNSYSVEYFFYNTYDDAICKYNYCGGVEITLNANIILNYKFHKTAKFYIRVNP